MYYECSQLVSLVFFGIFIMKGMRVMLDENKMKRINELAQKKKTAGLTEEEGKEQTLLRKEYLQSFRQSFKKTIENTTVIDPEGNDVTPDKVKDIQRLNNIRK